MKSERLLDDEIAVEARAVVTDLLDVSSIIMEGVGYGLSNESWDRAQYLLGLLDTRASVWSRDRSGKDSGPS